MIRYETPEYYFVWKPHGIPSTFGSQYSFLEQIVNEKPPFFVALQQHFNEQQEYGLLNRLDNDTAGLLYFAKTPSIKEHYAILQGEKKLSKIYLCDVHGEMSLRYSLDGAWISRDSLDASILGSTMSGFRVSYPIMHHAQDEQRMVAIKTEKDWQKGRGRENYGETFFAPLSYDADKNTTLCYAVIQQGVRHQIRVHAATIGYPIVGDILYTKHNTYDYLHLWSIGLIGDLQL